jgi:hypothetical protein
MIATAILNRLLHGCSPRQSAIAVPPREFRY